MTIEALLLLLLGSLVCIVVGANNASTCFGTSVGFIKYSLAAGIAAVGVFIGVILEGTKLSEVVSGGILTEISLEAALVIIIASLILMTVVTFLRLPLSLSQGLIGAAIGVGLVTEASMNWSFTFVLFASWVITPFAAAFVSIILYKITAHITHASKNLLTLNYLFGKTTLILAFYAAYVLGANTVGLVNGLYSPSIEYQQIGAVTFGVTTAFGLYFLSRGVTEAVGKGIVGFGSSTALVAQLSGALTVHLFTQFGLPVSTTQALVGGIFGIGLAKRIVLMNMRVVRNIVIGWTFVPLIGATISYIIMSSI